MPPPLDPCNYATAPNQIFDSSYAYGNNWIKKGSPPLENSLGPPLLIVNVGNQSFSVMTWD